MSEQTGLSHNVVLQSRERYGPDALAEDPQARSAAVSFVLAFFGGGGGWTAFVDPVVILTMLIRNAVVGVTQESSAEKAIAALQEYTANDAKVVRGGKAHRVKAEELVPGDVTQIAVGDQVLADCRLLSIHSNSFRVS